MKWLISIVGTYCALCWLSAGTMYLIGYLSQQTPSPFFSRKWHGAHDVLKIVLAPVVFGMFFYATRRAVREGRLYREHGRIVFERKQ